MLVNRRDRLKGWGDWGTVSHEYPTISVAIPVLAECVYEIANSVSVEALEVFCPLIPTKLLVALESHSREYQEEAVPNLPLAIVRFGFSIAVCSKERSDWMTFMETTDKNERLEVVAITYEVQQPAWDVCFIETTIVLQSV